MFVVRIRDNNSQLTPGVKILDNGPKMGLNGVDNGQIWFDHVKVPRDALLDKYASVSAEGVYSSSIKSVAQRFGVTVGGLTTGTPLACCTALLLRELEVQESDPVSGGSSKQPHEHQKEWLPSMDKLDNFVWQLHHSSSTGKVRMQIMPWTRT